VANIKSQIKRNRQNDKKRLRNRVYRGEARIAVRNAFTTIDESVPESKAALLQAISALDKAAEQGVIHKNNAARRKSRLMKAFAKMGPVKQVTEPSAVEPLLAAEASPKGKKKAAPKPLSSKEKAAARKVVKTKAEATPESKAEAKTASPKKAAPKKPAAKKATKASSSKEKKPSSAKKTTATSSPKGKKD